MASKVPLPPKVKQWVILVYRVAVLFKTAFISYAEEFRYYLKPKVKHFFFDLVNLDYKPILIRRRAHHVERVLWHPNLYPQVQKDGFAKDLDKLIKSGDSLQKLPYVWWSKKILREFGRSSEYSLCPVLEKGLTRRVTKINKQQIMELLKLRRSRRIFENTPLTLEEKLLISEAVQSAPSSCNRQTLEILFVEDENLKAFVAKSIPGGHQFFHHAPAIIIFLSDARDYAYPNDRMVPFIDSAAAIQNVYLLCEVIGLGCCWGSYTSFGSVYDEREVRRRLKIPDTHIITGSLAIGKSNQFVCEIPRDQGFLRYRENTFDQRPVSDPVT